ELQSKLFFCSDNLSHREPNSGPPTLVTLKVDPDGFFLYWTGGSNLNTRANERERSANVFFCRTTSPEGEMFAALALCVFACRHHAFLQEVETLDINTIRDTRTGKYAKLPKDAKLRDVLGFGKGGSVERKLVTVVYGNDLVNISYLNFQAMQEDTAKIWTDELFTLATNILSQNASRNTFLHKAYTKLKLQVNQDGKIPVKNILKMFSDKKRVETALEQCGLVTNKCNLLENQFWSHKTFPFSIRADRGESSQMISRGTPSRSFLKAFVSGLRYKSIFEEERESRSDSIMEEYETNVSQLERDQISLQAFTRYLGGEENSIVPPERLDIIDDRKQPLSHYCHQLITTTQYLTVGQLTGLSSVEMYRQGRPQDEEPYITHGFTMTTEIPFKEVIEAIAESAFKTSRTPSSCPLKTTAKQQAKMAEYCRTIFGDALLIDPLEKYPLDPGQPLPTHRSCWGGFSSKTRRSTSTTDPRVAAAYGAESWRSNRRTTTKAH
ncbi:hypothetical protein KUCAC02_000429, partial [Chaenocephalus aceratus]